MALLTHREHEDRPWGSFDRFTLGEASTVKILHIAAGKEFSLQYHHHRAEFWRVLSGSGTVTVGEGKRPVAKGDEVEIAEGVEHRLMAGDEDLIVLEIALGNFDEKDIVRVADDFGRTTPTSTNSG
ncbi:MAG: phosphomannose isomerase type II C-terminal cupin domain [bacterium]|nr:phosphomannose isomerase type II C-terminal cupin domain [bacterium]